MTKCFHVTADISCLPWSQLQLLNGRILYFIIISDTIIIKFTCIELAGLICKESYNLSLEGHLDALLCTKYLEKVLLIQGFPQLMLTLRCSLMNQRDLDE